jgi:Rrf2 family protein
MLYWIGHKEDRMITREVDYAIRSIVCLSENYGDGRVVSVSELATRMDIPYRFLRAVSRKLLAAGLVVSRRGNRGGLALARAPHDLSLLDVVRAVDRKGLVLNRCLLPSDDCSRMPRCSVHGQLAQLQTRLDSMLSAVRFDQLRG